MSNCSGLIFSTFIFIDNEGSGVSYVILDSRDTDRKHGEAVTGIASSAEIKPGILNQGSSHRLTLLTF